MDATEDAVTDAQVKARELLNATVGLLGASQPRIGQTRLCSDTAATFAHCGDGRLIAEAPTGTGKTLAVLIPAWLAALDGQRTVISTHSLALQTQMTQKDAPLVARAAGQAGMPPVTVAVHKGWSNYVCPAACCAVAETPHSSDARLMLAQARRTLTLTPTGRKKTARPTQPGGAAAAWGVQRILDEEPADKDHYPGDLDDDGWDLVTVSSQECSGADCPFHDLCPAVESRRLAGEADIVVTNHTLLAIQAARSVAVVLGNKKLGEFANLVVDECHALPDTVRNQGASTMSANVVSAFGERMRRLFGDDTLADEAQRHGRAMSAVLSALPVGALPDDLRPFQELSARLTAWMGDCGRIIGASIKQAPGPNVLLPLMRVRARLDTLRDNLDAADDDSGNTIRWIEHAADGTPLLKTSPVDVADALCANLWSSMNVVCLSATVPAGFGGQTGMGVGATVYESAFTDTYKTSTALYVPQPDPSTGVLSGKRLDTGAHQAWAMGQILDLVEANHGSALILAATTGNGQAYAERLRARSKGKGWTVYSQWDGGAAIRIVDEWKADKASVLVGTRGLMTGVDAPGGTCTLVIVDRVPRNAPNPVDDARVKHVQKRADMSRWDADRIIYYGDARTLVRQAVGRLIRTVDDHGLVAVLDPRLGTGTGSYPGQTLAFLRKALDEFGRRCATLTEAKTWIGDHQRD
jgi:ATP-dependent DNA helicase DinG